MPAPSKVKAELLFKTTMCKYGAECPYGKRCSYAHRTADLRSKPDLSRTTVCKTLINSGRCDNPACAFAHGAHDFRSLVVAHPPAKASHPPRATTRRRKERRQRPEEGGCDAWEEPKKPAPGCVKPARHYFLNQAAPRPAPLLRGNDMLVKAPWLFPAPEAVQWSSEQPTEPTYIPFGGAPPAVDPCMEVFGRFIL